MATTSEKYRINALAKDFDVKSKDLITILDNNGFSGRTHMAVLEEAELNVIFGGAQLDLRNAIIEGDCTVRANCIFGGITVLVPENVNVKVNSSNIFGGCSNKTTDHPGAHTVYITSNSIFGGTSIK